MFFVLLAILRSKIKDRDIFILELSAFYLTKSNNLEIGLKNGVQNCYLKGLRNIFKGVAMEQDFISVDEILQEYEGKKGNLIPILQAVQRQKGYLSKSDIRYISEKMHIPIAEIYGVVTFYAMFRLEPQGEHIIKVCKGTACHVADADSIKEAVVDYLKLEEGEQTTADGKFTVMEVACLGCCSLSPVIMIDQQTFGKLTPNAIPGILSRFKK